MRYILLLGLAALSLAACADDPQPHTPERPPHMPGVQPRESFHPPVEMMVKYDANKDGTVTWQELNDGLRAEFNAADTNHNGLLDPDEVRAANLARIKDQGTAASPLMDWNGDGHVDFHEFATAVRSIFQQFDVNEDNALSREELHPVHRAPRQHGPTQVLNPYGQQQ